MQGTTPGVERGCGRREQGGAYLECGLDPDGAEIWEFLVDPPHPFEVDSTVGQEIIEVNGVAHVFDWIGATHYPWPCDFVEEVRHFGLSRRVSRNFDSERLSRRSRIFCVHGKARYEGDALHGVEEWKKTERCALYQRDGVDTHLNDRGKPCTRKWWWAAEPEESEFHRRRVGDAVYDYVEGAEMPNPEPGIFASFPISNVTVIEADDGSHEDVFDDLRDRTPNEIPVTTSRA